MSKVLLEAFLSAIQTIEPFEDRYDLSSWQEFSAEEKQIATDALVKAANAGNARALMTLGEIGDKRYIETVRNQTQNKDEWVRSSANRALLKLEGSPDGLIADISRGSMLSRFAAVMDLSSAPGEEVYDALMDALGDPDPMVRSKTMDSLVERFGLLPLTKNEEGRTILETPLMMINSLLMADLDPLWKMGNQEARQVFNSLRAGATAESLGLKYIQNGPDGFRAIVRDAFFDDEKPFDTRLIQGVSGHDRRWAEIFLALQLQPHIRSPRAVEALVELEADWVVPALEASCVGLDETDPYFVAVQDALQHFKK
jgi:hypothetical protein